MNFQVIIPVVNTKLAKSLLKNIEENTLLPKKVTVIDNTKLGNFQFSTTKFKFKKIYSKTKMVNESLNVGFSNLDDNCDLITVLNDDLILGNWFFQRLLETFIKYPNCAVACPTTCRHVTDLTKHSVRYAPMKKRQGWAFAIRKEILQKIKPIPSELTTFHGDDWLWFHTHRLGHNWVIDLGNTIYHYVGVSIRRFGYRKLKRSEKRKWQEIKKCV